ncbi:MAG: MSMEG_1061 family FMN-dependent PPOX-type flavoprotein [Litoreibacter sp.]|uniref:MSMEG_1061 family FMN-dependent PPOX-type flavoprotein n=1 Tax=Litoreibacter sp. TaxID=1969459 RepID=UPI003296FBFB
MSNPIREEYLIKDIPEFRERYGDTTSTIYDKSAPFLSEPMQKFVRLSPFCVVSSQDADGRSDITPRGDPAGFVDIITPKVLLIPDRPGNQRFDTFRNILTHPPVSVLFMIPGVFDTLRVNGRGMATRDPDLLERCAIKGRVPPVGLLIEIDEAYGHCSKAVRRAGIWDADTQIDRKEAPSLMELMSAHQEYDQEILEDMGDRIERDIRKNMY